MIWLFILLPLISISIFFIYRKIPFQYLFIALIPIQKYGVSINDFVLKPFQLFGILLFFYCLVRNFKNIKLIFIDNIKPLFLFFLFFLSMVFVNMFNGGGQTSLKYILVVFVSFFSSYFFLVSINGVPNKVVKIFDSFKITGFVFCAVFLFVFILYKCGIKISGTIANSDVDGGNTAGIISIFYNGGYSLQRIQTRICGFSVDPNSFTITLLPPIVVYAYQLSSLQIHFKKDMFKILGFTLCVFTAILSLSRTMWFVIFVIFSAFLFSVLTNTSFNKKYKICFFSVVLFLFISVFVLFEIVYKGKFIRNILYSIFSRSSLNDENGRLTLWKSSLSNLFCKNPLFGLGLGNTSNSANLECHNTWIEYFAGNGIVVGTIVIISMCCAVYNLYFKNKILSYNGYDDSTVFLYCLVLIIFLLFMISYISSPEFWLFINIALFSKYFFKEETNNNLSNIMVKRRRCRDDIFIEE